MNKVFAGLLTIVILIQCKPKIESPPLDNKNAVLNIKAAFDNKNKWLVADFKDSLATVIHPNALYGHSNCWIQTAEDITIGKPTDSLRYLAIEVADLNVDVIEETGIVQGVAHFQGIYKQDTFDMDLCFVETYTLTNERWQLISRQAAKVPSKN